MQLGVLGALSSPPAGPGRGLVGGGAKPRGAPEIWHLKVQNTAQKNSTSWFSFLVQNEFKRKDHPSDLPDKVNDMFAQI